MGSINKTALKSAPTRQTIKDPNVSLTVMPGTATEFQNNSAKLAAEQAQRKQKGQRVTAPTVQGPNASRAQAIGLGAGGGKRRR